MENNLKILGKSGLKVSQLCYGTLAFSIYHANLSYEKAVGLLSKAYSLGVNFWDTAELYETYEHIKQALKALNYPDNIVISSRSYAKTYDTMMQSIEKCLKETGLDSIQIFGLHEVNKDEFVGSMPRPDAIKALIKAKDEGLIKAISVTTHSTQTASKAAEIDEIDIIMPLINYKGIGIQDGSLSNMESALKKAKKNNKGIFAMKVLAGGCLAEDIQKSINYAVNNPYIDSMAIGMDSIDEIILNSSIISGYRMPDIEKKLKIKKRSIHVEPWCIGCSDCIKACPQNAIILEFNQAKILKEKCICCGYCISACKGFYIKFLNEQEQL